MKRLALDIILFLSIFTLPWWFFIPLAAIGAFYFRTYAEAILGGLLMDAFYGTSAGLLAGFAFAYTLYAAAVLLVAYASKKWLTLGS